MSLRYGHDHYLRNTALPMLSKDRLLLIHRVLRADYAIFTVKFTVNLQGISIGAGFPFTAASSHQEVDLTA